MPLTVVKLRFEREPRCDPPPTEIHEAQLISDRSELLARLPKNAVCAEIGLWNGDFSQEILNLTQPGELHLIDPWAFVPALPLRWYGGVHAKSQKDMNAIHARVSARLAKNPVV